MYTIRLPSPELAGLLLPPLDMLERRDMRVLNMGIGEGDIDWLGECKGSRRQVSGRR